MRGLSLSVSESVLRPHSIPSFPKPFSSSTFRSKKLDHNSELALKFCSSRYSNQPDAYTFKELPCRNSQKLKDVTELSHVYKNQKATHSCNNSVAENSNRECDHLATDSISSDNSSSELVKFVLLFGLLTFEGSYPATAASDFASGLNPVPISGDIGDISTGFASAFLLIFFSELGDKTFFIAALLAARNSAATVFIGTFGALAAMTLVSVVLGRTFHYVDELLPFRFGETDLPVDDIAAVCLLVYFGVSTLLDASASDGQKSEDEQKEAELAVSEFSGNGGGILAAASTVVSTFLLVFVAEWGDKSFFSTIALAAASSPLGVIVGALAGHGVATLLAVLGGSLLGTFLSEKVIAYIGGVLFLVFAARLSCACLHVKNILCFLVVSLGIYKKDVNMKIAECVPENGTVGGLEL
ncbi:hypothetical protein L6164_019396 [Bauhinia variegata]|uniref:Uncharacterized protein n=1 Tax=Bauhinia variegata TaxID=167791 RepID=A0ACB9MRY3_BAUVA|nr:hypothetical protein L6164_019396 [Bauhinia variegata]